MNYIETRSEIDRLISEASTNGILPSDKLMKLNNKFRLEWNYNSNSMEGNTLTVAETRSVMIGNIEVNRKPIKDILEVKGHDDIIREILSIGKCELRLSEKRIKAIHTGIMYEEDPEKKAWIGNWKVLANEIINHRSEKYSFVNPEDVPDMIHDLLNRTNAAIDRIQANTKGAPHPIDVALDFHINYLNIHPFYDGNGRTARILSNLILVALGYPPFWITEKEREAYYVYISDIQCYGGDKLELFNFLAGLIKRSQQMINDVWADRSIDDEDDFVKEIELLKREMKMRESTGVEIKRTNMVVKQLYNESLKSLIKVFKEQCNRFNDFYDINKNILVLLVDGLELYNDSVIDYFEADNQETTDVITELNQWVSFENIKIGEKLNYYDRLLIEFKNDNYVVGFNNDTKKIIKRYDETLTQAEIDGMMKGWSEAMLKRIKSNFK